MMWEEEKTASWHACVACTVHNLHACVAVRASEASWFLLLASASAIHRHSRGTHVLALGILECSSSSSPHIPG